MVKRFEKKEVKRIPQIDKTQSKENIMEQKSVLHKSRFMVKKEEEKI